MYPLLHGRDVHFEGSEIVIWSPLPVRDCVKNMISLIFELQEDVTELIGVLEADDPIINSGNNIPRYQIKYLYVCGLKYFWWTIIWEHSIVTLRKNFPKARRARMQHCPVV